MVPDFIDRDANSGERRVFQRLRRDVPDNASVLHSLTLSNHPHKLVGEADFVVVSPLGVFVLEVKGGGVRCERGTWYFTTREGVLTKKEGPWQQAKSAMFAVREVLEKNHFTHALVGYGVVLPDETFLATGPELPQEVLHDRRHAGQSIAAFLERLTTYWTAKHHASGRREVRSLSAREVAAIVQLLRPDTRTAWGLAAQLSEVEARQARLTDEQARVLARLDANPRTFIEGPAGTGKTHLAFDFATRQARSGKRVLYLCFNRLLGEFARERASEAKLGFEANSFHAFLGEHIKRAQLSSELQGAREEELFDQVYPRVFEDAVATCDDLFEHYDLLVLDEAQDLLRRTYIDALGLVLKGGFERGRWAVFLDPNQTIFDAGYDPDVAEALQGYGCTRFPLTVNCRNTLQIASTTTCLTGLRLPLEGAIGGDEVDIRYAPDDEGLAAELDKVIRHYLGAGVAERDIIILCPRTLGTCGIVGGSAGSRHLRDLADPTAPVAAKGHLDFCTIHAFKGLERKVVIVWQPGEFGAADQDRLLYCGLSRARTSLAIVVPEKQRAQLEARFAANAPLLYRESPDQPGDSR